MVATVISTVDVSVAGSVDMTDVEVLIVLEAAALVVTSEKAVFFNGSVAGRVIEVHGTIASGSLSHEAILLPGASTVTVGDVGAIRGVANNPALHTLVMGADLVPGAGSLGPARLRNDGEITATYADAVQIRGILGEVENGGVIRGGNAGITFTDSNGWLTNSGTITANVTAVVMREQATLTNSGLIGSAGALAGVQIGGGSALVVNSGEISGTVGIQCTAVLPAGVSGLSLTNVGLISGIAAVQCADDGTDSIINRGIIVGVVNMGGGNDTFNGIGGTVTGVVRGGLGDDTYILSDPTVVLEESVGGGTDTVQATVAFALGAEFENLTLLGANNIAGAGNGLANVIQGNAGDNRLTGGAGNDSLSGAEGGDALRGGRGSDRLAGDDGEDVLAGGEGNDNLNGGDEDDRLTGGIGRDVMTGGNDDDTFVFNRLTDTGTTVATADQITDFAPGRDIIDLRAIDAITTNAVADNAFAYIGTAAFSNVAGQLRWSTSSGVTTVEMDVNGDSLADGWIRLTNGVSLAAGDFVL